MISRNLPKDIRAKRDPKPKNPIPQMRDIIEIVQVNNVFLVTEYIACPLGTFSSALMFILSIFFQLGQDIDMFAVEKVSNASGPIQPYLILVKSPLQDRIAKFFLVLDAKPMQIASLSLVKALDLLIKAYFVFNVKYPLGWRNTFHCLAGCFANVFESEGRKSRPDGKTPSEQELMAKISAK